MAKASGVRELELVPLSAPPSTRLNRSMSNPVPCRRSRSNYYRRDRASEQVSALADRRRRQ